jgi:hypothetical protein
MAEDVGQDQTEEGKDEEERKLRFLLAPVPIIIVR